MRSRNLARFLQPPTARERAARGLAPPSKPQEPPDLPVRIGPAEFTTLGGMIAVRCPQAFVPLIQKAGGTWEPGSRRWLVERRRIWPLIRALRRETDPLFRQAAIDLDEG